MPTTSLFLCTSFSPANSSNKAVPKHLEAYSDENPYLFTAYQDYLRKYDLGNVQLRVQTEY